MAAPQQSYEAVELQERSEENEFQISGADRDEMLELQKNPSVGLEDYNNKQENEDLHVDTDQCEEKNVLLIQPETYQPSKYQQNDSSAFYQTIHYIEKIRWKLNLFFLFRPFSCFARIKNEYKIPIIGAILSNIHEFLYRLSFAEIIFYILLIAALISQIIFLDGEGSGSFAAIWFTMTWILGMRNNFLFQILFGFSFERMIIFHRILGRFSIVMAFLHFWKESDESWFEEESFSGSMALIFAVLIFLTSLEIFRRKIFEIFYKLHWILFCTFGIFCVIHEASAIVVGVLCLIFDVIFRVYTLFFKKVVIENIKLLNGNVIRMEFNKTNFKYSAGQYLFICIPSISFTEFHPFSISSSPFNTDCILIHIRVLGDWTSKLQQLVSNYQEIGYEWNKLLCFMEGPYGELQVPLNNYSSIVMISGGIGITPLQSIFNQLIYDINNTHSNKNGESAQLGVGVKRIEFVWTVRDPSMIQEFEERHWAGIKYKNSKYESGNNDNKQIVLPQYFSPNLFIIQKKKDFLQETEVITHFYITRVKDENAQKEYEQKYSFLKFGRPNIENIIKEAAEISNAKGNGVAVLSCGPNGMIKDVKQYATKYGIDCHTEIFSF